MSRAQVINMAEYILRKRNIDNLESAVMLSDIKGDKSHETVVLKWWFMLIVKEQGGRG